MTMRKCYTELIQIPTFEERFEYLKLGGQVGSETFGFDRWINQRFYRSHEWKQIRSKVILRDEGRDLGVEGYELLICVSLNTHNAIHFGDASLLPKLIERRPNDTCPWKS